MGLDLWFQQDVARILASTHEAMAASVRATAPLDVESQRLAEAYQQGFGAALRSVAVAFGVVSPGMGRGGARSFGQGEVRGIGVQTLDVEEWR